MILPTSYGAALFLGIAGLLLLGLWPITLKAAGKWRFELYYFDFALGALLASILTALTFGSMGQELTFLDNLDISGRRQLVYAAVAGAVFNLGNLLMVAAMSVSGMAVAFAITWGIALAVGGGLRFLSSPPANPGLWIAGIALSLGAAACALVGQKSSGMKNWWKAVALSIPAGLAIGSFGHFVDLAHTGDIGLGPYPILFLMSVALFLSTFVYGIYFANLPVEGPPLGIRSYFHGSLKQHLIGITGGAIWLAGMLGVVLAGQSAPSSNPGAPLIYVFSTGGAVVAMLYGLTLQGGASRGHLYIWLAAALYSAAVATGAFALY